MTMISQTNTMLGKALQEIRFKRYHFNEILMSYIRSCFREAWSKDQFGTKVKYSELLLSRVANLEFEKKCLERYEEIVFLVMKKLEHTTTLEADLDMLGDSATSDANDEVLAEVKKTLSLSPNQYFAVVYRSEQKKTIRAQLEIVRYVQSVLEQSY